MLFLQIRGSLPLTTAGSQLKHPGLGRNQTHYRAGILQEALSEIWLHCESCGVHISAQMKSKVIQVYILYHCISIYCQYDVMGREAG